MRSKTKRRPTARRNGIAYTELNVGIDGLTVVVNKDSKIKCVDQAQLYAIFGPESAGGDVTLADAQTLAERDREHERRPLPTGKVSQVHAWSRVGHVRLVHRPRLRRHHGGAARGRLRSRPNQTGTNDDGEAEVTEPLIAKGTFPNDNNIVQRVESVVERASGSSGTPTTSRTRAT